MAILISTNGKRAVRVEKSPFGKEDVLQQYIYDNPESIPLYEIDEDIRLLILAREFPTISGPIDAIGVDKDGEIYIVESKLFRNPDRRMVVAQVLDYGAALWKQSGDFARFLSVLEGTVAQVFGMPLISKLRDFFGLAEEEETAALLENMRRNLSAGSLRFVVLMDKLEMRLKDLIVYLNQNSRFDVYAVEFEYYVHESQEIIIPKLYGAEVKREIAIPSVRKQWTVDAVLQDFKERFTDEEYRAAARIYDFCRKHADEVRPGTGFYGSFNIIFKTLSTTSFFTMTADGRLSLNFEWIVRSNPKIAELFRRKLEAIGFTIPDNYQSIRPSMLRDVWVPRTEQFLSVLSELLALPSTARVLRDMCSSPYAGGFAMRTTHVITSC